MFQLNALSYWNDLSDASLHSKAESELSAAWADADKLGLNRQALLITNTCRFTKKDNILYQKALHQLENEKDAGQSDLSG